MVFEKMSDKNLGLKSVSDKSVKIYLSDMKMCMLNKNVAYLKSLNDICLILCFIKSWVYIFKTKNNVIILYILYNIIILYYIILYYISEYSGENFCQTVGHFLGCVRHFIFHFKWTQFTLVTLVIKHMVGFQL